MPHKAGWTTSYTSARKYEINFRRVEDPDGKEGLLAQKSELTARIAACRRDIALCEGIFENTRRMKEKEAAYRGGSSGAGEGEEGEGAGSRGEVRGQISLP